MGKMGGEVAILSPCCVTHVHIMRMIPEKHQLFRVEFAQIAQQGNLQGHHVTLSSSCIRLDYVKAHRINVHLRL
jgi:hypothetical protein